jgi:hypothetical protein
MSHHDHGFYASARATRQADNLCSWRTISVYGPTAISPIVNAKNKGGAIEMLDKWGNAEQAIGETASARGLCCRTIRRLSAATERASSALARLEEIADARSSEEMSQPIVNIITYVAKVGGVVCDPVFWVRFNFEKPPKPLTSGCAHSYRNHCNGSKRDD